MIWGRRAPNGEGSRTESSNDHLPPNRSAESDETQRHRPRPHAHGVNESVRNRRGHSDDRRLARSDRGQVRAVQQVDRHGWHVREAWHSVAVQRRVHDAPVLELHGLGERAAEAHDDAPAHLGVEVGGVLNGAALERLPYLLHAERAAVLIHGDLDAGGDVRSLLRPAREPHAEARDSRAPVPTRALRDILQNRS